MITSTLIWVRILRPTLFWPMTELCSFFSGCSSFKKHDLYRQHKVIRCTSTGPMIQGSMRSGAVQLKLGVRMNDLYRTNDVGQKIGQIWCLFDRLFYDRLPFSTNKMNDLYRTNVAVKKKLVKYDVYLTDLFTTEYHFDLQFWFYTNHVKK